MESLIPGDFNEDGKTDIAVANYDSNNLKIFLGNGKMDIITANYLADTISVLLHR